jgi:hypothetical protein
MGRGDTMRMTAPKYGMNATARKIKDDMAMPVKKLLKNSLLSLFNA